MAPADDTATVAIPSKPGQRLQYPAWRPSAAPPTGVAIPSKPGQRLQSSGALLPRASRRVSQSLPNQVNDFNPTPATATPSPRACRNPFQTRSTTSISRVIPPGRDAPAVSQSLPNQVNDFNCSGQRTTCPGQTCRNPFQTRSTTSIQRSWAAPLVVPDCVAIPSKPGQRLQYWKVKEPTAPFPACRNPFQTRSTTSIPRCFGAVVEEGGVAIPSKPGQRLQFDMTIETIPVR